MRKNLLLLGLLLYLVACGDEPSSSSAPVELPTAAVPASLDSEIDAADGDSPRATNAEGAGLPPTFTPPPSALHDDVATVGIETNTEGTPVAVTPETAAQQTYTVQAGDTLAEIAAAFDISLETLAEANDIDDIDQIEVGDVLVIP